MIHAVQDETTPLASGATHGSGGHRLTPLRQFTLLVAATLITGTVLLGGVLAILLQHHVEQETVALTRREVEVHFYDIFKTNVFLRPLTEAEATRFDPMVRYHFGIYDIVQLRLFRPDGTMIYNYLPGLQPSDPPQPASALPPEHQHHLARAAEGEPVLARTQMGAPENIRQQPLQHVLEVYVPIRQDGKVVGIAQVYRDIHRQVADVRRLQALVAGAVGLGSLMLFVSLVGIFRDSTRRIRRQSEALHRSLTELQAAHGATLEALVAALDLRDHETQGHSARVTRYALAIGASLGLNAADLAALERGALLHDIGKIGVPDHILRKPGPLSDADWRQMRRHPDLGARMIGDIGFLEAAVPVVRHHHERFDGRGYPAGLHGEAIPLPARVFAVADTFDAMTSDRPYRRAMSIAAARAEIQRCAGSQFDPAVVEAFLAIPETELALIRQAGHETASVPSAQPPDPIRQVLAAGRQLVAAGQG
jgi:putative nucleotidyltransferase with HDIG domain